jgi:23S rRNA (guanosine2251-2'-O)-methyltransferase
MRDRKDNRTGRNTPTKGSNRAGSGRGSDKKPNSSKIAKKPGPKAGTLEAQKIGSGLFSPKSLNPNAKTTGRPNARYGDKEGTSRAERSQPYSDAPRPPAHKPSTRGSRYRNKGNSAVYLFGLHTVRAAFENPSRKIVKLLTNEAAWERLNIGDTDKMPFPVEMIESRDLDRLLGKDAIHQGIVAEVLPLPVKSLDQLKDTHLVVILDEVTDPHNVGAIMRSAVALGAGAIITTARNSPQESGVLAKSASGALEMIDYIQVKNLGHALEELHFIGFQSIGLDSKGPAALEETFQNDQIALVLGAEGKGLRHKTREIVSDLARLDMPGEIKSLNVSNAATLSLYAAHRFIQAKLAISIQ